MKRRIVKNNSQIQARKGYEADYIELMIAKRMSGEDIIIGGKPEIFTERKDGVLVGTNIRTDRFNEAMMAMDKIESTRIARGEEYTKKAEEKKKEITAGVSGTNADQN